MNLAEGLLLTPAIHVLYGVLEDFDAQRPIIRSFSHGAVCPQTVSNQH